jgi:thiol-disulfide isomerase/thioredoxin
MDYLHLFISAVIFIIVISLFRKYKSSFGKSNFGADGKKVEIYYANWCGHCKNALPEFKKAAAQDSNITLIESENPEAKAKGINSYPTIVRSDGVKYDGDRNAEDIIAFSKS